jgi:hypothetical protein
MGEIHPSTLRELSEGSEEYSTDELDEMMLQVKRGRVKDESSEAKQRSEEREG